MFNTPSRIASYRTRVLSESATMPADLPLLLEDLMDADDINNYVQHMFNKPLLGREEREICDLVTE